MKNEKYFMKTDDVEHQRLTQLNKVYNPYTFELLKSYLVKDNISILEYGCGNGIFAIELAKYLGNTCKIVAIDSSESLLQKARENAEAQDITNIEFRSCNIENMEDLDQKFDIIYGRWVLIFTHNISAILTQLTSHLKPNGSLICEELNFAESGHFSSPHEMAVDTYHKFGLKNATAAKLEQNTANILYKEFKSQKLTNIKIKLNQPMLVSPEEKSVYRLGLISMSDAIIKNNLCTKQELQKLIEEFDQIETDSNKIIGCFRNFIVSGSKF